VPQGLNAFHPRSLPIISRAVGSLALPMRRVTRRRWRSGGISRRGISRARRSRGTRRSRSSWSSWRNRTSRCARMTWASRRAGIPRATWTTGPGRAGCSRGAWRSRRTRCATSRTWGSLRPRAGACKQAHRKNRHGQSRLHRNLLKFEKNHRSSRG
jgi:hypothetical protein